MRITKSGPSDWEFKRLILGYGKASDWKILHFKSNKYQNAAVTPIACVAHSLSLVGMA